MSSQKKLTRGVYISLAQDFRNEAANNVAVALHEY
jgi:hypothetical protein